MTNPNPDLLEPGEYAAMQSNLFTLAKIVADMPVPAFLNTLSRSEATGPVLDPTAYRRAAPRLSQIKRLADALQPFYKAAVDVRTELMQELARNGQEGEEESDAGHS